MPDPHTPFSSFGPEIRAAAISGLHELLASPISEHSLHEWAGDLESRSSLLGEIAFFSIRWAKTLGQPHGTTFISAFEVVHRYWYLDSVAVPGGVEYKWVSRTASPQPVLFPGVEDADDYVVPVLIFPVFFWDNRIRVQLAGPDWDAPSLDVNLAGYKVATPAEQVFKYLRSFGPPLVLEDVRVVQQPYRLIP